MTDKNEQKVVAWIGTAACRDLASKGHAVVYAQTNPAADDNERPLVYGDTGQGDDFKLQCEVAIAPATMFGIGTSLSSVIASIKLRNEPDPIFPGPYKFSAAPEWLPIESAPKDGRKILLCASGFYSPFTGCFEDGDWTDDEQMTRDPTHWMPLPPPPALSADEGEGK